MKSLGGIGAIILGVVAILVSVGLQTIWAPPAVFHATTEQTQDAPLTLVTDAVDIDPDEAIEYTVSGDGDFTMMYGQLRDIEAWIGDAAYNRIDGVTTEVERGEDPTINITYVDGEAEVPNPATSDLWLATQDVTDEVTQRWARSDAGTWALLIAADGVQPAPTDFSISWVNVEPDSGLITPLMIGGIVLILLGLGLLIWRFIDFRRRAKRTSGRRAAIRGDYTGLTAADVRAEPETATQSMALQQVEAGDPVVDHDAAQETEIVAGLTPADLTETEAPGQGLEDDSEDDNEQDRVDDPDDDIETGDDDPGDSDAADADAGDDTTEQEPPKDSGFLRRVITAVTALGLAGALGLGPAYATSQSPEPEDIPAQVEEDHLDDEIDPEQPDTFPVVVDAQFDRILHSVVATVARGDQELDTDLIDGRVGGQALRVRDEVYRNIGIDDETNPAVAIADDVVLATWMDRDPAFPRTIYTVTQDADGSTQTLVLEQESARSQYKLINNAPFAPEAELPTGDLSDHDVTNLAVDETANLVMSPQAAMEAAAAYFSDADATDEITQNPWIDAIHKHQEAQETEHAENDTEFSVTRTIFDDSVHAVRLPNGSALVFGTMNSMEALTPTDDASVTLPDLTTALGDFDSPDRTTKVRIRYREQLALLVPQDGKISLIGYETVQSSVD